MRAAGSLSNRDDTRAIYRRSRGSVTDHRSARQRSRPAQTVGGFAGDRRQLPPRWIPTLPHTKLGHLDGEGGRRPTTGWMVSTASLDAQAGDRPGDHELLDLARAFEDRVDHTLGFVGCVVVPRGPADQERRERPFHLVSPFPPVSGDKTRDESEFGPDFDHFDFATSLAM